MSATNFSHPLARPLVRAASHFNLRIKEFPDHLKLTCFSRPIFNPEGVERYDKERERKVQAERRTYDKEHTRRDSLKRTKDKAMEIAFANDWTYFVTLTLDKSKISRTDPAEVGKKLKTWLNNKSRRIGLKYLVFPEFHKDGESIHFHGLMAGDLFLQDSGKKTEREQTIYKYRQLAVWLYDRCETGRKRRRCNLVHYEVHHEGFQENLWQLLFRGRRHHTRSPYLL